MRYTKEMLLSCIAGLVLFLSACRTVDYTETTYPDGRLVKEVDYRVFGFDTKVGGLNIEATKDSKKLILQDLDTSSANAMNVIGNLVNKIPSPGATNIIAPAVIAPRTDVEEGDGTRLPPRRPATNPANPVR